VPADPVEQVDELAGIAQEQVAVFRAYFANQRTAALS
jgi:hypothetical protein